MSLVFNATGINSYVKPAISRAKTNLTSSRSILSSLVVPVNFSYRTKIINISSDINNIETRLYNYLKWLDEAVSSITNTENKSLTTTDLLINSGSFSSLSLNNDLNLTGATIQNVQASQTPTGSFISTDVVNNIAYTQTTGTSIGDNVKSFFESIGDWFKERVDDLKEVGAKIVSYISSAFSSLWDWITDVALPTVGEVLLSTAASISNIVISLVKGIAEFGESLVDLVALVGTGVASAFTGLWDGGQAIYGAITGNEWESVTKQMWGGTMSFVAEGHVSNAFGSFYQDNAVGQWLDEHAWAPFQSDGIVSQIASGLGYVAGVVALTIATLGIGTAVSGGAAAASATTAAVGVGTKLTFATVAGVVATAAGTGKGVQDAWANIRDRSFEGIERAYASGQINQETYELYTTVHSMSEEEWQELTQRSDTGELLHIDEETYRMFEEIRNIPGEWKTFETGAKGIGFGVLNGLWEGAQWFTGSKLATSVFVKGGTTVTSHLANSAIRIGIDSGMGALDSPFRMFSEMIYNGKSLEESWEDTGGWSGLAVNTLIATIASTGGEVFDFNQLRKTVNSLNTNAIFDNLDEELATRIKTELINRTITEPGFKITDDIISDLLNQQMIGGNIGAPLKSFDFLTDTSGYKNVDEIKKALEKGKITKDEADNIYRTILLKDRISISNETGYALREIFNDPDYIIGIHRTGNFDPNIILNDGLLLSGHASSGVFGDNINLNNNISFFTGNNGFEEFVDAIGSSSGYKTFNGQGNAVIVKIPKSDFNNFNQILTTGPFGQLYLKPEYLQGYVSAAKDAVSGKSIIGNITYSTFNPNIIFNGLDDDIIKNIKADILYRQATDPNFRVTEDVIADYIGKYNTIKVDDVLKNITFTDGTNKEVENIITRLLAEKHITGEIDVINSTNEFLVDAGLWYYTLDRFAKDGFDEDTALKLYNTLIMKQQQGQCFISAISPDNLSNAALMHYVDDKMCKLLNFAENKVDKKIRASIIESFKNGEINFAQLDDVNYYNEIITKELANINSRVDILFPGEYSGILDNIKNILREDILSGKVSISDLENNNLMRTISISYEESILRDILDDMSGFKPSNVADLRTVQFDSSQYKIDFDVTIIKDLIDPKLLHGMEKYYDWNSLKTKLGSDGAYKIQSEVYYILKENNIDLTSLSDDTAKYLTHIVVSNRIVDLNPFAENILRNYNLDRINHEFLIDSANKLSNASKLTSATDFIDEAHFANFVKKIDLPSKEFEDYLYTYIKEFNPDAFNEFIKIVQLNDFARTVMPKRLLDFTDGLVGKNIIELAAFRNQFMSEEAFRKIASENAMAHNTGIISQYSTGYDFNQLLANIYHENLHQVSGIGDFRILTGVERRGQYRGINETITEYFNKMLFPSSVTGYDQAVERLRLLVNSGFISDGELKINYFVNHDILPTLNRIFEYDQTAVQNFLNTFDKAINSDQNIKKDALKLLDQMINDLLNKPTLAAAATPTPTFDAQNVQFSSKNINPSANIAPNSNIVNSQEYLDNFRRIYGDNSDSVQLDYQIKVMEYLLKEHSNNPDTIRYIQAMLNLNKIDSAFAFRPSYDGSYFTATKKNSVFTTKPHLNIGSRERLLEIFNTTTPAHEGGHAIDYYAGKLLGKEGDLSADLAPLLDKALWNLENTQEGKDLVASFLKIHNEQIKPKVDDLYNQLGKEQLVTEKTRQFFQDKISQNNLSATIDDFFETDEYNKVFSEFRQAERELLKDAIYRGDPDFKGLAAMSDMLSSVAKGNESYILPYAHSSQYYASDEKRLMEQFAQFTTLKVNGRTDYLDLLKDALGEEWYNGFDSKFNEALDVIINYTK